MLLIMVIFVCILFGMGCGVGVVGVVLCYRLLILGSGGRVIYVVVFRCWVVSFVFIVLVSFFSVVKW